MMNSIQTILFPTDFSDIASQALPYATSLAQAFGAKLILMHGEGHTDPQDADAARQFTEMAKHNGSTETVRVKLRDHPPSHHILTIAKERHCDLIVMATQGQSAFLQFFLGGSTAEEVVRFSKIPVLTVKTDPNYPASPYTGRLQEILFPTDLSDISESAFPYAAMFAKKFAARLLVLHVIDEDSVPFYRTAGIADDGHLKERVEELLKQHLASLPGADAITSIHISEGNAETEILKFAQDKKIDLVAMATHGHSGIREDLLGSTTDRVIRQAACPVLASRGYAN